MDSLTVSRSFVTTIPKSCDHVSRQQQVSLFFLNILIVVDVRADRHYRVEWVLV